MRIFIGILLLLLSIYLGYILSSKYRKRLSFFNSFYEFNNTVSNEVYFSQSTILQMLKNQEKEDDFIQNVKEYLQNKKLKFELKYLSNDDLEFFNNYLKKVGGSDKKTQEKFLENANVQIEKKLNAARDEEKKYRLLYIKLGFLVGLIALIICL